MLSTSFAENRFGLGARGDEPAPGNDPRGWVDAQLTRFEPRVAGIPDSRSVAIELADYLDARRMARADRPAMMTSASMPKPAKTPEVMAAQLAGREAYATLVGARINSSMATPAPFAERLAHF